MKTPKLRVLVFAVAVVTLTAVAVALLFGGSASKDDSQVHDSATASALSTIQLGAATLRMDLIGASPEELKLFLATLNGRMFEALEPYSCSPPCAPGFAPEVRSFGRRMENALLYCSQISTDVFRHLAVYRTDLHEEMLSAFDETCLRLKRAVTQAGAPVENEFWRIVQQDASLLVKQRPDWVADSTPARENISINLRETGEYIYHTLRGYLEGPAYCNTLGFPRSVTLGCSTRLEFPERMASLIGKCAQLYSREAIAGSAGYDPAVHEPLATALDGGCKLLEDAYFVLGYPEDNEVWHSLVPRVLDALEPAIR